MPQIVKFSQKEIHGFNKHVWKNFKFISEQRNENQSIRWTPPELEKHIIIHIACEGRK